MNKWLISLFLLINICAYGNSNFDFNGVWQLSVTHQYLHNGTVYAERRIINASKWQLKKTSQHKYKVLNVDGTSVKGFEAYLSIKGNKVSYECLFHSSNFKAEAEAHIVNKNTFKIEYKVPNYHLRITDKVEDKNIEVIWKFTWSRIKDDKLIDKKLIKKEIFLDDNDFVVPIYSSKAKYVLKYYEKSNTQIIGDVVKYNLENNKMVSKFKATHISTIGTFFNIINGEATYYNTDGSIQYRIIYHNELGFPLSRFLKEINNKTQIGFYHNGNIKDIYEIVGGSKNIEIRYNNKGDITFAQDYDSKSYYEGNPNTGYSRIFHEDFEKPYTFNWPYRDDKLGVKKVYNGKYLMHSKVNGGLGAVFNLDFDLNNSNWSVNVDISRQNSIEGAGVVFGASNDATTFQAFVISGDGHFRQYNFYNGFNISKSKEWQRSFNIKKGNTKNRLSILKLDNKIYYSVNGVTIYQTDYITVPNNILGLFTDKTGNKILYDDFIIKQLGTNLPDKFKEYIIKQPAHNDFIGNGTGFLINKNGYVATNYHVIENANQIFIELEKNGEIVDVECTLVCFNKINDLAILKLPNPTGFNPISFSSSSIKTGTEVFTIGFPYALSYLGNEIKFTDGNISSLSGFRGEERTYQISVPVQPGNSGGPLLDFQGNLVGIVNAKFTAGDNVSYAIKSSYLKALLNKNGIKYTQSNNSLTSKDLVDLIEAARKSTYLIKIK